MYKISMFLIFFFISCQLTSIITKQDTLKINRKYYELDVIRVVAKTPEESVGKITIKEINKNTISPDMNLGESLKDIPGLNITVGNKGESNLRIRSFSKEDVKIMIDGRMINGGYFGNVSLNEIPMFDLSEVQVVKGPVSPLYGTNNMGGVVNYITKKPNQKDWLKLSTLFKRNNTQNLRLSLSHQFKYWDFWTNFSSNKTDGMVLSDDFKPTNLENGKIRNNSDNASLDFQSKLNFSVLDLHSIGFSFGYTDANKKKIPSSIYESIYRQFTDWKRYQSSILSNIMITPYVKLNQTVSYDAYNNTLEEYLDPQMQIKTLHSVIESWSLSSKSLIDWEIFPNLKSNWNYSFEKQVYNRKDDASYLKWTTNNTRLHNFSLMTVSHWKKIDFSLGSGLSYSQRIYKNETINTSLFGEPSIGVFYPINDKYDVRLGFSANIQYPTMHQLYSSSRGNPYLNPERAYKYELNFNQRYSTARSYSIEHSFFYNDIVNMIEQYGNLYTNMNKLKNFGYENIVNFKIMKNLNLENQACYMNLYLNKNYLFYTIPNFSDSFALNYNLCKNLSLKYSMSYQSIRYDNDDLNVVHKLKAYQLHSIQANYAFKKIKLTAGLQNIFDKDYQEEYGYPGSGINYSVGFETVIF